MVSFVTGPSLNANFSHNWVVKTDYLRTEGILKLLKSV